MNAGSQILTGILMGLCVCILTACGRVEKERSETAVQGAEATLQQTAIPENYYIENSKVTEVMRDPAFGDYGHLIFPVDIAISEDLELKDVEDILPWYSEVNPKKTVEIVNYMKDRVTDGEQIFYDIYSEEEKEAELAKNGYNAFALIYRPGADTACEDLARAIAYLHEHAQELQIDMTDYSLWGGSAGARMAAWLGSYGTAYFGEEEYPAPAAVIMQYTGLSSVTGQEPPTYACVGTSDYIASYESMEQYISRLRRNGTNAEIEVFTGLPHGFGLGEGTVADGWINRAMDFWQQNSSK